MKDVIMHDMCVPIIGYMHSDFKEKFGIPRQPNLVNHLAYIEMSAPYDDLRSFDGIHDFSHLWLLWQFHDNKRNNRGEDFVPLIRPPRLGGNAKVGVFASRSMYRPSQIGLSVVQFENLTREQGKIRLYIRGADLLDGTPIVDIKPYIAYADALPDAVSGYAAVAPTRLDVKWLDDALIMRERLLTTGAINSAQIEAIEQILAFNPTPAYQHDSHKVYGMRFAQVNIHFLCSATQIVITDIAEI